MKIAWTRVGLGVVAAMGALTMACAPDRAPAGEPRREEPTKGAAVEKETETEKEKDREKEPARKGLKSATFGGGCFWCVEAVYQELKGVEKVVSGYTGGAVPNPTYEQVCSGTTGHAEVAQITYDPAVVGFADLLEVFWKTHDPTTLNRQGNDRGTQYRSAVFYEDDDQKKQAEAYKAKLDASGAFAAPIVTEIVPLKAFYPAEKYHQNYFLANSRQPYCQAVIVPKLEKFRKVFRDKLKN